MKSLELGFQKSIQNARACNRHEPCVARLAQYKSVTDTHVRSTAEGRVGAARQHAFDVTLAVESAACRYH